MRRILALALLFCAGCADSKTWFAGPTPPLLPSDHLIFDSNAVFFAPPGDKDAARR